jgi:hypothetical protein
MIAQCSLRVLHKLWKMSYTKWHCVHGDVSNTMTYRSQSWSPQYICIFTLFPQNPSLLDTAHTTGPESEVNSLSPQTFSPVSEEGTPTQR